MPKDRSAEQGDVDGFLECSLALGMVAAEARGNIAARQAAGTRPWIGVNDSAEEQRLQADYAVRLHESANFQLGGPEKLTDAHDPRHATQKNGGLADQWYMDDGVFMCHPTLVLPFPQDFDVANDRVGAERKPLKTEVIYDVNDLDAAPPECRIGDVPSLAKTSVVTDGSITLGVAVGSRPLIADQLLSKADVIRAVHERVNSARTRRQSSPSERVWESVVSTTSCESMVTKSLRNKVQRRFMTKLDNGPSIGSSPVSRRTAWRK